MSKSKIIKCTEVNVLEPIVKIICCVIRWVRIKLSAFPLCTEAKNIPVRCAPLPLPIVLIVCSEKEKKSGEMMSVAGGGGAGPGGPGGGG